VFMWWYRKLARRCVHEFGTSLQECADSNKQVFHRNLPYCIGTHISSSLLSSGLIRFSLLGSSLLGSGLFSCAINMSGEHARIGNGRKRSNGLLERYKLGKVWKIVKHNHDQIHVSMPLGQKREGLRKIKRRMETPQYLLQDTLL
jgi:hypothetical protein